MIKSKVKVPANIDTIELADYMKTGITTSWLKRREKIKSKPLLVRQS